MSHRHRLLLQLARAVGDQLSDPTNNHGVPPAWWRQSLAHGAPGIALLHVELAAADLGPWQRARDWLAYAVQTPVTSGADSHLYYGAPAVAHALACAATVRPGSYQRALAHLDEAIARDAHGRIDAAHARIDRGELPQRDEYDLIRGLTGIGAHLLRRDPDSKAMRGVLEYLVRLTLPICDGSDTLPGWWVPTAPNGRDHRQFSGGHANMGMAHGIAGPLALLALAVRHGTIVDGQLDAIGRICTWLDRWRADKSTGPVWPYWINRPQLRAGQVLPSPPRPPSWCYGTAGLARAQHLAAQANGDTPRQHHAAEALLGALTDGQQLDATTDACLCHGHAGLAHVALRTAADALPAHAERLRRLAPSFMDTVHPANTVARDVAAGLLRSTGGPGLLEGAAGVALAALAVTTGPPRCGWDTCLLITTTARPDRSVQR